MLDSFLMVSYILALSCGPTLNITNADVLVSDDEALYACHYGHIPSNTNNKIVCEAGDWSRTDFQCLGTYCKHVTVLNLSNHITNLFQFFFIIKHCKPTDFSRSLYMLRDEHMTLLLLNNENQNSK